MSNGIPLISVIIPTFNRKEKVVGAVESVLQQDYDNFELIVVDDGSTDGTKEYLEGEFKNIKVIRQENKGVSGARNLGIKESKGEYIAFLDSDDRWLADKLSRQISYMQEKLGYDICHTEEIWYRNGVRVNPMKKHQDCAADLFNTSLKICVISTSSAIIKKTVFDDVGLYDESMVACEDYDLWLRITAKYKVLFLAKKLVVKYGGSSDQLSKKYWGMDRFRVFSMGKLLERGILSKRQEMELKKILQEKLKIFIKGALKHNNTDGVRQYKEQYRGFFGEDSFYSSIDVRG